MVQTGLDVVVAFLKEGTGLRGEAAQLLRAGHLGLVTNPSAVTSDLVPAPEALRDAGASLCALFGPEHGVRGDAADGVAVPHSVDRRTGVRAWSLYGAGFAPTDEMLAGLDALVFDIQDVGARFYTFSSTLSYVMAGAARKGLRVIILDRPNPIGGERVEGPLLEPAHASFVGLHPVPIRHGATLGELGRLWAMFGAGDPPLVVRCHGWRRQELWDRTGLQWVPPSPNMPTPETALVYPGMCLLEGTNVSEARGTTCPFRWFGAPWIDADALAGRLHGEKLPGARFRPVRFTPTASKYAGEACGGCQVHVTDPEAFRAVTTGVAVLAVIRQAHREHFAWREADGKHVVDRLAGTSSLRDGIDAGNSWHEIEQGWRAGEAAHRDRLREAALYP